MKKIISIICILFIFTYSFTACSDNKEPQPETEAQNEAGLSIVTTIFPEYDWVKNILGQKAKDADLTMLLDSGVDLHSYRPSANDIIKISKCDMFIYVGGESDSWVDDVLKTADNEKMIKINLLEVLGDDIKEEEQIEGMQDEEEPESEDEKEYDEHVWLSLKNAKKICTYITGELAQLDGENAAVYNENSKEYIKKLDALDSQYEKAVDEAENKTLLFADRFPFRYLTDDYDLDYFAAFKGCSAESEASFETITFLSKKIDELGLKCVITLDGSEQKIAQTIINGTKTKDQSILTLNSMQGITAKAVENGADYLSIMQGNLDVLKQALA